ncbi:hypothetical protein RvY_07183-1 [Ramazzottius varieornatus]|uniref:Uncharacterized protein n=1 Tax=Ramazzottius varieornatus TaxID=947166 RepID=A0A1D1V171_RAMVA|nr:hypothetical protein RvY_07183-1 [Ramazzottius varieornatus]
MRLDSSFGSWPCSPENVTCSRDWMTLTICATRLSMRRDIWISCSLPTTSGMKFFLPSPNKRMSSSLMVISRMSTVFCLSNTAKRSSKIQEKQSRSSAFLPDRQTISNPSTSQFSKESRKSGTII